MNIIAAGQCITCNEQLTFCITLYFLENIKIQVAAKPCPNLPLCLTNSPTVITPTHVSVQPSNPLTPSCDLLTHTSAPLINPSFQLQTIPVSLCRSISVLADHHISRCSKITEQVLSSGLAIHNTVPVLSESTVSLS